MKTPSLLILSLAVSLSTGCSFLKEKAEELAAPVVIPPKPSSQPPARAETLATLGDLKTFWTVISGYDYMSVPAIRVELMSLSNQTKANVFRVNNPNLPVPNVTKLALRILKERILRECMKIEPRKRFAYLKLIYVNGDAPEVAISMTPKGVLPAPVSLRQTENKIVRIPCGLHVASIKARFKQPEVRLVPAFMDDDTFIVFITTTGPDRIYAGGVQNVVTLPNSTCSLFVFSMKDTASFRLESPLLLARPGGDDKLDNPLDKANQLDLNALANIYPAMKTFLELKGKAIPTTQGILPMKLVEAKDGANMLELPAPIFLSIPAGEYKINGKVVVVDKPFHRLDLDQP